MRILFLQYWYDMYGGAETVNHSLANQFVKDGYEVMVQSLYRCGNNELIDGMNYQKQFICDEPKRPSYKEMVKKLFKMNITSFFTDVQGCIEVKKRFKKMPRFLYDKVENYNPDWIIVTNPEILSIMPSNYLNKCLVHIHSGCEAYFTDPKLKKVKRILFKYQNKVHKLVWLTKGFMDEGKKHGLINSTYMYNPVRIKSNSVSKLDNNTVIFIGRIAPVKRVYLLAKIFSKVHSYEKDWQLNIYGSGNDDKLQIIDGINLMGPTNDVKQELLNSSILALTSSSEGFPMVILEAYECGVPVIVFNFKNSCSEVVIDNQTGFIVKTDDENEYFDKLKLLCEDEELRKRMGNGAKEYVKKFYPEIVVQRWYKLFKGEL